MQIVTEDLVAFYRSINPEPLDVTYQDFVAWQRSGTNDKSAAMHIDYWKQELEGYEPLRLPTDWPRPDNPGFDGDHVDFELSTELTQSLLSFALSQRCAVSSAMAAVFQALMSLNSGQTDITIGTVLAGRDDRRFADVLGFFVNTVVLRTHIAPSTTFRDLIQVARAKMVDAYAHQQAPFEQVVAEVRPDREAGRNAIFDVVVVHNGQIAAPGEDDEISGVPWAGVATRFDLELVTHLQDGRLHGSLVFRTSLFHRRTATRLVSQLVRLVENVLRNPDDPIFGALHGQLDYWRKELADAPAALELPIDHTRPPVASYRCESVFLEVDPGVVEKLRVMSGRHDVTMFTTLLATFAVALSRYARTTDVPVGVPATGPVYPDPVTGFDETLVMRIDLSGDPTFPEVLGRVRETTLGAYRNQAVPFGRLIAELVPQREFGRNPLVQVAFSLGNDLLSTASHFGTDAEPFDLECHMADHDGVLDMRIAYNADLFDRVTVERFIRNLHQLLAAVGADLTRPLSALQMLTDSEMHCLTEEWNDTTTALPNEATVPAAFSEQARLRPHVRALVCDETSLTYEDLDTRSNQLAHRLRTLGARPGTLVGVCLPRSIELIAALLAILKTGAAYLPIDPDLPEDRQRFLLNDGEVELVITADLIGDTTIDVEPSTALPSSVGPQELAYVIYTSGSTGNPKGVEIEHQSILRLVAGLPDDVLGPGKVVLHASSVSFDAATFEIWGALLTGATCVISTERVLTAKPLASAITRHRITTAWMTSSLFNHIIDEDATALIGLRHLLVGGEALSVTHVRRAVAALPGTQLFNAYGPTECTTFSTCHPITGPIPAAARTIPIGRPIGNTRVYVLDDYGRLAPTGVPGELHVAGLGIARGYRGQQELTAARFIPNRYDTTSERLYRTGDVVRHNTNGDIEYLGRLDDQVKIRGYRIEPGEIEVALQLHPGVSQAAVIAHEDTPGQKRLVAYLGVSDSGTLDYRSLRALLRRELPAYMMPAAFVSLPELPLTVNGKLNIAALPETDSARLQIGETAVRPQNAIEEELAALWAGVLDLDSVHRDENFFEVGGHSLKAAQLVVQIQETFDLTLPLRTLFERPTIARLAEEINGGQAGQTQVRTFDPQAMLRRIVTDRLPPREPRATPDVLLTGATGFVGAFLVRELLMRTDGRVHCLVRAVDEATGWHRLRANLDRYGLLPDIDQDRLKVVTGDLAAPGLGLTDATFDQLAAEIELICHNGARVDALSSYEQLEMANVGGTCELIRLAATTRLKRLQLVSTISADDEGGTRSGYAETKSHAEELIVAAHEHGVPAGICRLPRIVGDSRTGQGNTRDIMLRLLRIILELGAAPDTELEEPWIEVDRAASVLAGLSMNQPSDGNRFVLTNRRPVRLTHLLDHVRSTGTLIETRPLTDWLSILEAHSPEEHAILKLLFDSPPDTPSGPPGREFAPVFVRSPDRSALLRYVDRMLVRTPQPFEGLLQK